MRFTNAVFVNAEHTSFDVDVELEDGSHLPYTFNIDVDDDAPVFQAIKAAYDGGNIAVSDYVPPVISDEQLAFEVRLERDKLLSDTDYLVQPDYPLSAENSEAVRAYRQALRDITDQEGFPRLVEWPRKPEVVR